MESAFDGPPRTYCIRKSPHMGYGFIAGHEYPTMIKMVEPSGPSFKRLVQGDVIMAVNGINVENESRERIIKQIQLSGDQIEVTVRHPTYEELIRAKNLADPKFYTLNKPQTNQTNYYCNQTLNDPYSMNKSPLMNRLVTSISHQQQTPSQSINQRTQSISSESPFTNETPPVQMKSHFNNVNYNSQTRTLGRNGASKFGRHSPCLERCKSSMDNKKSGDEPDDQPVLKRSNTMRPIRPSPKVLEIFEVVIKIFFEDGHTKVLNYNQNTTVKTIVENLNSRMIQDSPHSEQIKKLFGLVLTVGVGQEGHKATSLKRKLLHILDENDSIMKIRQLPYAPRLRLLYRMVYMPGDVHELYVQDKTAFEYLYNQSLNDLRFERFSPQLEGETALKLSALYIVEYVLSNYAKAAGDSRDPKTYLKLVKKTPGIEHFLPLSLKESLVDRKGKRQPASYKKVKLRLLDRLKKNFEEFDFDPPKARIATDSNRYSTSSFHELCLPETKNEPNEFVKLLFLNFLSQLPCYGNSKRPPQTTSSTQRGGCSPSDCSSSLESVPRTSDSSPLIKQDSRFAVRGELRPETGLQNTTQINAIRSISSVAPSLSHGGQSMDQPDVAQTPSIDSISSITFNMQNSPSPINHAYQPQHGPNVGMAPYVISLDPEPSPKPRKQHLTASVKSLDSNLIETVYSQRYKYNDTRPLEELIRNAILPPPPPPLSTMLEEMPYQVAKKMIDIENMRSPVTKVLSDRDIEGLKVPPPPGIFDRRARQV